MFDLLIPSSVGIWNVVLGQIQTVGNPCTKMNYGDKYEY
jgi:hypothetical protein